MCKENIAKEYNRNYSREIIHERGPKNGKTSWKTSDGENRMKRIEEDIEINESDLYKNKIKGTWLTKNRREKRRADENGKDESVIAQVEQNN